MEIRSFKLADYKYVRSFQGLRGIPEEELSNLPEIGYVAKKDSYVVALGFLRQCEGDYCIFDSLITNPDASSEDRNEAINALVKVILDKAKFMNFKGIILTTSDKSVQKRAEALGFTIPPQRLLVKSLG